MTTNLADYVRPNSRFSRSANVERDHGGAVIDGYIPTGRALDVISRVASGIADPTVGRTFTITGPHGGGKSSLAVFLDGLLAGSSSSEFKRAHSILKNVAPDIDYALRAAIRSVNTGNSGFVRAFATARCEPVATTIARALHSGAQRHSVGIRSLIPAEFGKGKLDAASDSVRSVIHELTQRSPVLLVLDEFGKNLEYFATSGSDGDPFLLQELAEMTQGDRAVPLVIITMQHLSFDDYVQRSSATRRREWAKVQGRFQDIPYIETPSQSRRLIASTLEQQEPFRRAADSWVADHRISLESLGLRDLVDDAAPAMPLHPVALAVLPELCNRYGQNERTLFSFLAGSEPSALPAFLEKTAWKPNEAIPFAGLDLLYDYFLESSGSMIGVADSASRWIEIETRIRDTPGLTLMELRVLKTIGLLNLVASGGRIRASEAMLRLTLGVDVESGGELESHIASLIDAGLITYRAFSDEYRIWQGSDYNLRKVIENARSNYSATDLSELLSYASNLDPVIAGRHSQRTGVLRVFARIFDRGDGGRLDKLDSEFDGVICYSTDPKLDTLSAPRPADGRPAIFVIPADISAVRHAAIDAAALNSALQSAKSEGADWVAQTELVERASAAQQRLQMVIADTWNVRARWVLAGTKVPLDPSAGVSALLSDVADVIYSRTPHIANEMIARRELTSQGAKARRTLTDALLAHREAEAFAIKGYGPERAIYEAVFRKTGIHRRSDTGHWELRSPSDRSWKPAWSLMNRLFDCAVDERTSLASIRDSMTLPPVGLKDGIVPLLLIAGLVVRGDDIALYEHGTLVLSIDDAVAERLTKNLGHFTIKNTEVAHGKRSVVIDSLATRMGITNPHRASTPTFLNVASALYRELRLLPPYSQKTRVALSRQAIAVREAFHQATEPDVLLFETLPGIFGMEPFRGRGRLESKVADEFADRLAKTVRELREAYPRLLTSIRQQLAEATSTSSDLGELRQALSADATRLDGNILEPRLKAFVGALCRPMDDDEWLENLAMVVCEGQAPRVWTDDVAGRFFLRVAELGGALRRTSALLHDRLAANKTHGYASSRMTLTRPDGTETIELLALTEPEKAALDPHFERLLDTIMENGVSRAAACRILMARLAIEHENAEPLGTGSGQERNQING
ncbi:hypothetical protein AU192_21110 [Mycobacterium lehmannii]|uniref:Uncharacterized protein n=1 Tax=Mycobacterium lehmannii TaxID=2048550 RepID=A0A101A825_9MYCO|nr:hypothetical protein [Mycobacterium lehmannii]KUI17015.1 hypothetical protein AU192_21110 [Mycobacterium lehmannii]